MAIGRRRFLVGTGLTVATASMWGWPHRHAWGSARFGPLEPDPEGILDLPHGFTYRVLDRVGDVMGDGYVVPGLPDGMACFTGADGSLVLMRNHELVTGATTGLAYPLGAAPPQAFDPAAPGCVTRVVVDADTFARRSSNLVLAGTERNCAGGPSPWGWLSCEESTIDGHGYVFACSPHAPVLQAPVRLPAYGRFRHEAAIVDPSTNIAYLTEDRGDGALYRFVPDTPTTPFEGRLQALRIVDQRNFDTGDGMTPGKGLVIEWVDIEDADPAADTVRTQAQDAGAAIFRRNEGICMADGGVYVAATSGGASGAGQLFRYDPDAAGGAGSLELLYESDDPSDLNMPDNIVMAPWGDLFMCEDSPGSPNLIRFLTPDGIVEDFARNVLSGGELAGVCFSPDGRAMFVNLWADGLTLVITGPFPEVGDPPPEPDPGATDDGDTGTTDDGAGTDQTDTFPIPEGEGVVVGGVDSELACACEADDGGPGTAAVAAVAAAAMLPRR